MINFKTRGSIGCTVNRLVVFCTINKPYIKQNKSTGYKIQ